MRKIGVFTSTRADYGLLRNLIREIDNSPKLSLQLLVSGTHLVADQGMTVNEIRADGFALDHCIEIKLSDDSPGGICDSMGKAVSRYGKALETIQPDILVILGDRFESFCCAAAATVCRIPIAHIHGGESTVGAMDEAFRHSITKMAHLHFPSCDIYRQRIIQLGETPDRVFDLGALGVENIKKIQLMTKHELETSIGFKLDRTFFLVTFHPVTLENETAGEQFGQLLAALDQFQDHQCIFTQANADTDGKIINQMMYAYVDRHSDRCMAIPSLGYLRYLSAMKLCAAVVGNSSSGILEAPVFKVPTINIGDRQKGRVRMKSIIDCRPEQDAIMSAISNALSRDFVTSLQHMQNPYEKKKTAVQIKNILATTNLDAVIKKEFYDFRE
jgi:GDP/UDP-N,N'-diacetylbacillosamine 2-epimerase (hydrolysing)